jgi:NADH-quinone oxidoreductase subunit D
MSSHGLTGELAQQARMAAHLADARVSVDIRAGEMTLNIGPQHPATHGVLRIVVTLEGEKVESCDPVLGYMHRGYEKLAEVRTYPQITTLVNRIDWVSGFANEIPLVLAAEALLGVEAPPRALYIRTLLAEMQRIASHLVFFGAYPLEVGAITPMFHSFRERERVLDLIESVTGGRFHPNYNRIGGLKEDLPAGFKKETAEAMESVRKVAADLEDLLVGNDIFAERTKGIGVLPASLALELGVSGPNLRASGVAEDIRRSEPYLVYDELEFDVITEEAGDAYARTLVRLRELVESTKIVDQCLDSMPAGPIMAKVPRVIKIPEGEIYVRSENPRGEMGFYLVSRGGVRPYRLKIRSASFSNISCLPYLLKGVYVADIIAILGSLDFVLGDVDR